MKNPAKSKTIWGIGIAALPVVLPFVGLSISESDTQLVSQEVDNIIQSVGLLIGVYGRVVASGPLGIVR